MLLNIKHSSNKISYVSTYKKTCRVTTPAGTNQKHTKGATRT